MLEDKISQDLKAAMLARDEQKTTTLRSLKSAFIYAKVASKSKGGDGQLDDASIEMILVKEARQRQESADGFIQGGAHDRAARELAEKLIIESYLPAPFSDDEVEKIVDNAIKAVGASDVKLMGQIITAVKAEVGSRADGAKIANLVKARLAK